MWNVWVVPSHSFVCLSRDGLHLNLHSDLRVKANYIEQVAKAHLRWRRSAERSRAGLSVKEKLQRNRHISFQNESNLLRMFDSISLGNIWHRRWVFYFTSRLSFICFKVLVSSTICTDNIQCKLGECADLFEGRKQVHLKNWTLIHAHYTTGVSMNEYYYDFAGIS